MRTSRTFALALGLLAGLAFAPFSPLAAQETDVKLSDQQPPTPRSATPRRQAPPQARQAPQQAPQADFRGLRSFFLTDQRVQGFGQARERAAQSYSLTDTMWFYAEPVGFGFTPEGGQLRFRAKINFEVLDSSGNPIAKSPNPASYDTRVAPQQASRFFLTYSLDLNGIQEGDFIIRLTLTDDVTGRNVSKSFPIQVRRGETS